MNIYRLSEASRRYQNGVLNLCSLFLRGSPKLLKDDTGVLDVACEEVLVLLLCHHLIVPADLELSFLLLSVKPSRFWNHTCVALAMRTKRLSR